MTRIVNLGLLFTVAFLVYTHAGPIPTQGKENVFNYQISVGKEDGPTFKQGYIIDTKVIVRKKPDSTYNIQITDVEVRCHKNQAIPKEKYKQLESKLKIPFDYNPEGRDKSLTVYAPETAECESANIKRGLVNILEFYDSDSKTIKKISKEGSSGKCVQIDTPESETDTTVNSLRFSSIDSNCSSDRPHQQVHKGQVASFGTYCDHEPKVSRTVGYKISKSKDGQDKPQILIKSSERLVLQSIFPVGLFDDITAKTILELKEVRDPTSVDAPTGAASTSDTEVRLDHGAHPHDAEQAELLTKAKDGFKALSASLNKLDTQHHLEDQEVVAVLIQLTIDLRHLNKDSLVSLYKSLDQSGKSSYFQILGIVSRAEAFEAVKEIYQTETAANNVAIGDQAATFFENLDPKAKTIKYNDIKKIYEFYGKLAATPAASDRLKHAIVLSCTTLTHELCIRKGKQDENCPSTGELHQMVMKDAATPDDRKDVVRLKALANLQIREGIDYAKRILEDRNRNQFVRSQAAWALLRLSRKHGPELKDFLMKRFFDRKEDHEVRIASFIALAISAPTSDYQSAVQYLVSNQENEDRQLLSYVMSALKTNWKRPEGSRCPNLGERLKIGESMKAWAEKLGPQDIFDSAVYTMSSASKKESAFVSVVASKTDIVPRSIYINLFDPLNNRAYSLSALSDGLFYQSLVQLKGQYDQAKKAAKEVNADVKAALDNIFTKVKGKAPSKNFTLALSERIDGMDVSFETFDKPEALIQRMMSAASGADRHIRSLKKYNTLKIKSHTESGIHVKFMTTQGAITSVEIPQFSIGKMAATGVPISFKYSYKFASKAIYAAVAELPESDFRYMSGKLSDKAGHIPRNVTLTVVKKMNDQLNTINVKGKSEPLWGADEKDIFYRALTPMSGNYESLSEYKNLLKRDKRALDVHSHLQEYLGFGITVSRSVDYQRPSIWESPLTRWSFKYQEVEEETKPYTYKIALTKLAESGANSVLDWELTVHHGVKNNNQIMFGGLTITHPKDATKKSIRAIVGRKMDVTDPNKRALYVNYENANKKLYLTGYADVQMPDNDLKIPDITRGTPEWAAAYPKEKITLKSKWKFTPTGRTDVVDADLDGLLKGIGDDVDAEATGEFYRTEEQAALFGANSGSNTIDTTDFGDDNYYAKLIGRTREHPTCSLKAWDRILKFHGFKSEVKVKKQPIPDAIKHLHRRIKFLMAKRHFAFMTFDPEDKLQEGNMKVYMNSTVDNKRTDMTIKDKDGAAIFKGFESKILPLVRPSTSPIKVFYHNTFNPPVCSLNAGDAKKEIETFDGKDIPANKLDGDCEYLLVSNCRGIKNFAITYNKKTDSFTVLYDNKHKIIVSKTGFTLNGAAQPDKKGLVAKADDIALGNYKGLLGVRLPNKVTLIREKDSSVGHIQASRLFRGRLCGLCGDSTGDPASDEVKSLSDFAVSGSQCA